MRTRTVLPPSPNPSRGRKASASSSQKPWRPRSKRRATATAELLTQRALVAELDHAEALALYLPRLGRYFALQRAAFSFEPPPPNLKQIIQESRNEAMRAAQAEASADLEPGPLRRGIKRLAGAVGFLRAVSWHRNDSWPPTTCASR